MHRIRLAVALVVLLAAAAIGTLVPATLAQSDHGASHKSSRIAFHDAMRKLWEDHITWTRLYIVSAATLPEALPDLGPTADRLLQNQADIGDALRPFYGDAAGDAVTELLREHILTAAALIDAAKAGDADEVQVQSDAWYANANQIAAALHDLNPRHWRLDEMQSMMKAHLDRTLEEAVARLEGRYADDIAAYEQVHADILAMADMLSDGIIAQFPQRSPTCFERGSRTIAVQRRSSGAGSLGLDMCDSLLFREGPRTLRRSLECELLHQSAPAILRRDRARHDGAALPLLAV